MSIYKLRLATAMALVALLATLGACSLMGPGEKVGAPAAAINAATQAKVSLSLATVHPRLAAAVSQARPFVFMDKAQVKVVEQLTGNTVMDELVTVAGGAGSGDTKVDLVLAIGTTYFITVNAYNSKISSASPSFTGTGTVTPRVSTNPWDNTCYINLLPISTTDLVYYSPSNAAGIVPAIYNPNASYDPTTGKYSGAFIQNGSEAWFKFLATSETIALNVNPAAYSVYGALYDDQGRYLAGALSPAFSGGAGTAIVVNAGTTTGKYYYFGLAPITQGAVTDPSILGTAVSVSLYAGSIPEDPYETDDTLTNATYINLNLGSGFRDGYANDQDWMKVDLAAGNKLDVTATSSAYPNGIFGELRLFDANGMNLVSDESYSNGSSSTGRTSFHLVYSVPQAGTYYILANFQGSDPIYNFPVIGGAYRINISMTAQAMNFVPPSVGAIRKGKLLSNPNQPGQLAYLYLDSSGSFYSMRSSDSGTTWSPPLLINNYFNPVLDFAADMDGSGNALFLSIEQAYGNQWTSTVGFQRPWDSYWNHSSVWGYYAGGGPLLMASPSVSRMNSGDILFGYGYDMGGLNIDNGASAHTVTWSSMQQYFYSYSYVPLPYEVDNPWNNQVFYDWWSGDSYYMYPDNHGDFASTDLFAMRGYGSPVYWNDYTEYRLVDAPYGTNVSQPWMGRLGMNQLVLVYVQDDGLGNSMLKMRQSYDMYTLASAGDSILDTGVKLPDPWNTTTYPQNPIHDARTVYSTVSQDNVMHIAYIKGGAVYRTSVSPAGQGTAFPVVTTAGPNLMLDGLVSTYENGQVVLYLSWHDDSSNHVERITP